MGKYYLDEIMAFHRKRGEADLKSRDFSKLFEEALQQKDRNFQFSKALASSTDIGIIAEIKKQSPSKGNFKTNLNPRELAKELEMAGACGISILTDEQFFGGSLEDLKSVKQGTDLPILRKDFTVSGLDIIDAYESGASAVLLIMTALSEVEVFNLAQIASQLKMDSFIEVHTEQELKQVLDLGLNKNEYCILVNQRDLTTFEEHNTRAVELASHIPKDVLSIAASCINSSQAIQEMKSAGYKGALVGEYLMKTSDPASALKDLLI